MMQITSPPSLTHSPRVVFVVDDERPMLELLSILLEEEGYLVRAFDDPEEALRAYSHGAPPPDLVITDFRMGPMNGLGLIRACRHLQPNQKTILTSGTVDAVDFVDAAEKPDRFLLKPCASREFTNTVRVVLGD